MTDEKKIKLTAKVRRGFGHIQRMLDIAFDESKPPLGTVVAGWKTKVVDEINAAQDWLKQNAREAASKDGAK